jgi:hypothetical protein
VGLVLEVRVSLNTVLPMYGMVPYVGIPSVDDTTLSIERFFDGDLLPITGTVWIAVTEFSDETGFVSGLLLNS